MPPKKRQSCPSWSILGHLSSSCGLSLSLIGNHFLSPFRLSDFLLPNILQVEQYPSKYVEIVQNVVSKMFTCYELFLRIHCNPPVCSTVHAMDRTRLPPWIIVLNVFCSTTFYPIFWKTFQTRRTQLVGLQSCRRCGKKKSRPDRNWQEIGRNGENISTHRDKSSPDPLEI